MIYNHNKATNSNIKNDKNHKIVIDIELGNMI